MLVYVAGKYRGDVETNIAEARKVAIAVWEAGHVALCPHLNTAHFENDCQVADQDYLNGDLNMLSRCDAIVMVPGWEGSVGASAEYRYAKDHGIPIYEFPNLPPLSKTEVERPIQCEAFRNLTGQMYRTHLAKNADYSAANILGTGEIGLVTRLWDKISRLMSLTGFRVEIASTEYTKPTTPKNEAVEDTYLDAAVYSLIGLLYRAGNWGR